MASFVASQMLLNQVSSYQPTRRYTTPTSETNVSHNTKMKPRYEQTRSSSEYAFGWQDPREIYYG